MLISGGSLDIFVTRPISGGIFLVMAPVVMASIVTARRRRRLAQRAGTVPIEDELATAAPDPRPPHDPGRPMNRLRLSAAALAAGLLLAACGGSGSGDPDAYPSEQIRMIASYTAGGATDIAARPLAK